MAGHTAGAAFWLAVYMAAAHPQLQPVHASPGSTPRLFRYHLDVLHPAKQATAAVYRKADDAMVRTLWHRVYGVDAGLLEVTWDGSLDEHVTTTMPASDVIPAEYEIKVQMSNVSYTWEGAVGNSGPATGPNVMFSLDSAKSIAVSGNIGIISLGYNEASNSIKAFMVDDPHGWINVGHPDETQAPSSVAYDGTNAYFTMPAACTKPPDGVTTTCQGAWGVKAASYVAAVNMRHPLRCEHNFTAAGEFVCSAHDNSGHPECPAPGSWTWGDDGGNSGFDGCNGFGWIWSSGVDLNKGNVSFFDNYSKPSTQGEFQLLESAQSVAVTVGDGRRRFPWMFVAHPYLNETRIIDKLTGTGAGAGTALPMTLPKDLAAGNVANQLLLWAIEANVSTNNTHNMSTDTSVHSNGGMPSPYPSWTVTQYHNPHYGPPTYLDNGTYVKTTTVLPGLVNPASISVIPPCQPGAPNGALSAGGLVVADAGDGTVKVFNVSNKLVNTIGVAGGFRDGNPTVTPGKFMWDADGGLSAQVSVAADEHGAVWVTDVGNRRILRFNLTTSELIGTPVSHATGSYTSAASRQNASRVFSNFWEYAVDYAHVPTKDARYPASESWVLARNWMAGAETRRELVKFGDSWGGFQGVAEVTPALATAGAKEAGGTPKTRTLAFLKAAGGSAASATQTVFFVELDPMHGMQVLLSLDGMVYKEAALNPDGSIMYHNDTQGKHPNDWNETTQEFIRLEYDPVANNWTFPGEVQATLRSRTDQLRKQGPSWGGPTYPTLPDGSLIIFDCSTGKQVCHPGGGPSSCNNHTNKGMHLGALATDKSTDSKWKWQASPWGSWGIESAAPIVLGSELLTTSNGFCKGYNVSEQQIPVTDKDGRYGGNDTALQYGGSIALAIGDDVIYGFHGEFWRSSEANQFLHWRNGLFIGQFGRPNHAFDMHCGAQHMTQGLQEWVMPGHGGNSFSPSVVPGRTPDELFMYHNEESPHGGVARWRISGLTSIKQVTSRALAD